MLVEIYIEALLADEVLADQVWGLWNAGVITDEMAAIAWGILAGSSRTRRASGSAASTTAFKLFRSNRRDE